MVRTMRRFVLLVLLLAATSILSVPASAAEVPGTDCRVFPSSNIWNTRIDALPVHAMSDTWSRSAQASTTSLHPDFGPPSYGMPFETVRRRHPKVRVDFTYADESDRGPYPFDARTPIEDGSDRHALMIERGTCRLYELFAAQWNDGNLQGTRDDRWRNRLLDQLRTVPASAFEAVDARACMVEPDSGRADCPA
jgi:hypothetical protein